MHNLNIIFAGTPEFAASHLRCLLNDSTFAISAVFTQPDRAKGRGKQLHPSPVKHTALEHQLAIYQPSSLNNAAAQAHIAELKPDVIVVVAYGLILPAAVLNIPRLGCINVHASLLPRWRGAAPIERAIEAGDKETGISLMQMGVGLDDGPILLTSSTPINDTDTGDSLRQRLATLGCETLLQGLNTLAQQQTLPTTPQHADGVSYAHKLSKAEAVLDWQLPARQLCRKIRAFNSLNPCYFTLEIMHKKGLQAIRIKVYAATSLVRRCALQDGSIAQVDKNGLYVVCNSGQDLIVITQLQLPGGNILHIADVLNGRANWFQQGTRLR